MKKSVLIELIIFLILIFILTFFGVKVFKNTFDIGTTYHLVFKDINGIVIGSPVRILGVDIGHVTKIRSNFDEIYIDFVIPDNKVKIPNGTRATIEFFGIAGSRSIELTPPDVISDTKTQGIIVEEPIRLGDALGIMGKFIRASMVSIGGLYEFAKGRTQADVTASTEKFLTNTKKTSQNLDDITIAIENGGEKLHQSFDGTTKGMARFNTEISNLNIARNFNLTRYSINFAKRNLIEFSRGIKSFNNHSEEYSQKAKLVLSKTENLPDNIKHLDSIFSSMNSLDKVITNINSELNDDNLNKIYQSFDNMRIFSENMNNSI